MSLDVRITDQRIEYLMEQTDGMPAVVVPSVQAFGNWPKMIFAYLQENIHLEAATNHVDKSITESDGVGQVIDIACEYIHSYC